MKTSKRILAILLSILMTLSCAMISVSAEDADTPVDISISGFRAVKFDAKDPETVLQLQMYVSAAEGTLNDVDPAAQISVYEMIFVEATSIVEGLKEGSLGLGNVSLVTEPMEQAKIAVLKPVSIADGILTLDVFSKDGSAAGAKMISFALPYLPNEALQKGVNFFGFSFPQGALKDTQTGKTSAAVFQTGMVEGLASREVKLPSLIKKVVTAFVSGNSQALASLLPMLPFLFVILPFLVMSLTTNIQKLYNVYGINVRPLIRDAYKAIRRLLPKLLSGII